MKALVSDKHLQQLHESGIEYYSWLGLESVSQGLEFKYFNPKTKRFDKFGRIRLDKIKYKQKYAQPPGSGCWLYFPATFACSPDQMQKRRWYSALEDGDLKPRDVVIVEGEKKALSLQQALGPRTIVLGLGGVSNWGKKDEDGDKLLIKEFEFVKNWKDRRVYICFDSDVETNAQVERAEFMLQRQLRIEFGVRAYLMTLPPMEDGSKAGIDDLIVNSENFLDDWYELKRSAVKGIRHHIPEPISGRELCDTEWEFERPILGNGKDVHIFTEAGTGFIHAGSGVGKTYLMLQLAACIAAGDDFLGFDTQKKKVLFLQQELSNGWFARRVRRLRKTFGVSVDELSFLSGDFPIATQDRFKNAHLQLDRLERLIVRNEAGLVILDPMQGFYNLSEGSVDHAREFMKAIVRTAKKTGACIIMSHHDRKDTSGPGISQMRGGSPFSDLADTVLGIKRMVEFDAKGKAVKDEWGEDVCHETDLVLRFDKVRHSEGPLPSSIVLTRMEDFDDGSKNPFFRIAGRGWDGVVGAGYMPGYQPDGEDEDAFGAVRNERPRRRKAQQRSENSTGTNQPARG